MAFLHIDGTESSMKIINDIKESFYLKVKDKGKCLNVCVFNRTWPELYDTQDVDPKIGITPNYLLTESSRLTKILQNITTCPIAVTFDEDLLMDTIKVMKKFRQYVIIKFGGEKPTINEILGTTQPVIWVDQKIVSQSGS